MSTTYRARATGVLSRRTIAHAAVILIGLVMLYPLLWMVSSSLEPNDQIFGSGSLLPHSPSLANYRDGWTGPGSPFSIYLRNDDDRLAVLVAAFGQVELGRPPGAAAVHPLHRLGRWLDDLMGHPFLRLELHCFSVLRRRSSRTGSRSTARRSRSRRRSRGR